MATTLRFVVEDVATQIVTYDVIRVYRATSVGGTYSALGNESLVSGTVYYSYSDSSGTLNHWYRYTFYNTVSLAESSQSAPFRVDGTTRLRIRQSVLDRYGIGYVLAGVNSGSDANTLVTSDYRVKSSIYSTTRGKGTWLRIASGTLAGETSNIVSCVPATASFDVSPDFSGTIAEADQLEWHTHADPKQLDNAINRAAKRYWFLDRVPLAGVSGTDEYSLASLPWLFDKRQIRDVRYYPSRTSAGVDDGIEESWGTGGRWWNVREDQGIMYLTINPTVDSSTMFYLYCVRQMPELWEDSATPPIQANEELWAASAYDELLAYLTQPHTSPETSRISLKQTRAEHHRDVLSKLLRRHHVNAPIAPNRLPYPVAVPTPWTAR